MDDTQQASFWHQMEGSLPPNERYNETRRDHHWLIEHICSICKSPEEAEDAAKYLATIHWQEEYLERKQRAAEHVQWEIEQINKELAAGHGICDDCHRFVNKLYSWPHLESSRHVFHAQGRFCWKCFDAEQKSLGSLIIEEYREVNKPPKGTWIVWHREMWTCNQCGRLIPWKSRFNVANSPHAFYCLHCVEIVAATQFITCDACGKKTTNLVGRMTTCRDCITRYSPYNVSSALARARSAGNPATLTPKQWAITIEYFSEKCAYCRASPYQELEHFLPISLGGGTTWENCVPSCEKCNGKKRSRHPDSLTDLFPHEIIESIRNYLQGDKQCKNAFTPADRALVLWHGEQP